MCLIDAWLRTELVPKLPVDTRLLVASRNPPTAAWTAGWQCLVASCPLPSLSADDARRMLLARDTPSEAMESIVQFAQGHPLTLELAHAALTEARNSDLESVDRSKVIAQLALRFLEDLTEPETREALEAASVVRRASRSWLESLLGREAAHRAIERLGELGFVERTREGLSVHPVVRQALEGELRAIDPTRHRQLRRSAWLQLRRALPTVGRAHLWEHAADCLYLVEKAQIREAFFPSGVSRFSVEPATAQDWPMIAAISRAHDSDKGVAALESFARCLPDGVHVVRDEHRRVTGFYIIARSDRIPAALVAGDPLMAGWAAHHAEAAPALFLRRMAMEPAFGVASEPYAACVLDLKRSYIENPSTPRLYVATSEATRHPDWDALGFRPQPTLFAEGFARGGGPHTTFTLDFGEGGIFAWIGRLVDAQYEQPPGLVAQSAAASAPKADPSWRLDEDRRCLVVKGLDTALTPLQYELLCHLLKNVGRVVGRDELIESVWRRPFVGSNVVDAAVRSLRKKLGEHADVIETIKGFGYRLVVK